MMIDLEDYFNFLKFKSISSEAEYKKDILDCVHWLKNYLDKIDLKTELWESAGHPVLFASYLKAGPEKPTLLIYNHYDVQPVDPLELWTSPPFEPTIKEGEVYARGAQDNKGQCFYVVQALKHLIEKNGTLPINIKLCIEGEEECGSANLPGVLKTHKEQLQADYLAIVDLGIPASDTPAITLGIRGLTTMDVEVEGSNIDLHSGSHGGIVYNPIHALVEILAKVRDPFTGRIFIPGFYDEAIALTEEEKQQINLKFDEKNYLKTFGASASGGEKEFPPLERNWLRPTLEINGIHGGYCGTGFKTVIPAKAHAKISCRLVPGQDPEKMAERVAEFIKRQAPEGITVRVTTHIGGGKAARSKVSSKIVQVFAQAFSDVFGKPCEYIYSGATIPIVNDLVQASGAEVVMLGLGLATDCIHAPNEHFGVDRLKKGASIIANAIERLGKTT